MSFVPTTFGVFLRALAVKVFFKFSKGFAWVQPRVIFIHSERITIGSNFGVNSGSYINGLGGIEFGSYVLLGSNVTISSGLHSIDDALPPVFSRQSIPKKIVICDDVWIGSGAVIMLGVRIAKGTVISANAVVTKDTEEYSVMVGVPAVKLRMRVAF